MAANNWFTVMKYAPNGNCVSEKSHRSGLVAMMAATSWAALNAEHDATVRLRYKLVWGTCNGMPGAREAAIDEVPTILEAATIEGGQRVFDASMAGGGAQLAFTFG